MNDKPFQQTPKPKFRIDTIVLFHHEESQVTFMSSVLSAKYKNSEWHYLLRTGGDEPGVEDHVWVNEAGLAEL